MEPPSPKFNIFLEMEFSSSRLKYSYNFSQKTFSYISGGTPIASKIKILILLQKNL